MRQPKSSPSKVKKTGKEKQTTANQGGGIHLNLSEEKVDSLFNPNDEAKAAMYEGFMSLGMDEPDLPSFKEAKDAYFRIHGKNL